LGVDNDLRGYVVGRYQHLTKFAVQAEARMQFTPRWGGVVFAGVGQVAPVFNAMTDENLLPAGGFGVPWMAAPKKRSMFARMSRGREWRRSFLPERR
jgi:hypothetical protein